MGSATKTTRLRHIFVKLLRSNKQQQGIHFLIVHRMLILTWMRRVIMMGNVSLVRKVVAVKRFLHWCVNVVAQDHFAIIPMLASIQIAKKKSKSRRHFNKLLFLFYGVCLFVFSLILCTHIE